MLTRVDFTPQLFLDQVNQKGLRILWEKAVNCPCIDPKTTRPVQGCPNCDSRGKLYFGSSEIKGIVLRQDKELQIGDTIGVLEPGSAFLTVAATNKLTVWDRVTLLDSLGINHETVIHDEKEGDWLRYPPVGNVEYAVYQPTRTSLPVELKQGVDFTVEADGKINWLGTNRPAHATGASFRYVYHPVWLVVDAPNYIRDTFVAEGNPVDTPTALTIRVQIRLEHLGAAISNS